MKNFLALILVASLCLLISACDGGGRDDLRDGKFGGGGEAVQAPEDVTGLSALAGDSQVTLDWTASLNVNGDLSGYNAYQNIPENGADDFQLIGAAEADATSHGPLVDLVNGQSYTFMITSFDFAGNESAGAVITVIPNPDAEIADTEFDAAGALNGGGVLESTQVVIGRLPAPPGGAGENFPGKAYLVLNGDRISLDIQKLNREALDDPTPPDAIQEGDKIYETGARSEDFTWLTDTLEKDETAWVFKVTFTINAGPNILSFEVFDSRDALFARSKRWRSVGAVNPKALEVTLTWATDMTDLDLHLQGIGGHCYYQESKTETMELDYDYIYGYGPEHITVSNVDEETTYQIKVYYHFDHNRDEHGDACRPGTPTPCAVTAKVNGFPAKIYPYNHKEGDEGVYLALSTLTEWSFANSWYDYWHHVWNTGEVVVGKAKIVDVVFGRPDLSNWPTVKLPVTVTEPYNNGALVIGLEVSDFSLTNAGKLMAPLTLTDELDGSYTLQYTDNTAGKRDVYVYVYFRIEAEGPDDEPFYMGGLSETITYGDNYALLTALDEYPPAVCTLDTWGDLPGTIPVTDVTTRRTTDKASDFSATFMDAEGGTDQSPVTITPNELIEIETKKYRLKYSAPSNYLDYDKVEVKFLKQYWLSYSVADVNDLKSALLTKALQHYPGSASGAAPVFENNMWEESKVAVLTNAQATESAITGRIETITNIMEPYDLFLYYFSGHGSGNTTDGDKKQYLCTYEDENWISVYELGRAFGDIPHKVGSKIHNTIVLLDSCFSGNFIGQRDDETDDENEEKSRPYLSQTDKVEGPGTTFIDDLGRDLGDGTNDHVFVMTAVTGDKEAWANSAIKNSVFTYFLVEGINVKNIAAEKAKANTTGIGNKDTWVTGEEAYDYLDGRAKKYVDDKIKPKYPDASQEAQVHPNTNGKTRLIYCW